MSLASAGAGATGGPTFSDRSVAGSSSRAGAGSRHSGSERSSPSAGRPASGSSSAASWTGLDAQTVAQGGVLLSPTRSGSASRSCDRRPLRPRAGAAPAADPSRPGGVDHRRAARRRDRRRDDHGLAGPAPALVQLRRCLTPPSPTSGRPFTHKRERHGLVGPFSGRQLALPRSPSSPRRSASSSSRPRSARTNPSPARRPAGHAYILGPSPSQGLRPGDLAPELVIRDQGGAASTDDLDGKPIRLADLKGKAVWINFWATWCPPCQSETPVLRDIAERYRDQGLEVVGISVQETSAEDVARLRRALRARLHDRRRPDRRHLPPYASAACRRSSSSDPTARSARSCSRRSTRKAPRPRSRRSCRNADWPGIRRWTTGDLHLCRLRSRPTSRRRVYAPPDFVDVIGGPSLVAPYVPSR